MSRGRAFVGSDKGGLGEKGRILSAPKPLTLTKIRVFFGFVDLILEFKGISGIMEVEPVCLKFFWVMRLLVD